MEEQLAPPTGGVSIPASSLHFCNSMSAPVAWQRLIRERHAQEHDPLLPVKRKLARSFDNASMKEVDRATAKPVILKYEWLRTMGATDHQFGLYFGEYLAGVICFGRTAGTKTAGSVCGPKFAHTVKILNRGACVHWAHPHSASFSIRRACHLMSEKGFHVFVAYSDTEAGEIGTVYQASNWLYCGPTNSTEQFRTPDGKVRDARQVHCLTRDRTGGTMRYKRTRAEQKEMLLKQGCEFFDGTAKHRYIGLYGDRRIKRTLRRALRLEVLPYPKRPQVPAIESVGTHAAETPITNII